VVFFKKIISIIPTFSYICELSCSGISL